MQNGDSVAKWLAHLPLTSAAASSNLTKYFLNATRTQSSCEKSKSQRSAESRGFSPGTSISSHRESWQGGLGKKGPQ
jgi:aspartate carbamoyltransferase catalytic subunit